MDAITAAVAEVTGERDLAAELLAVQATEGTPAAQEATATVAGMLTGGERARARRGRRVATGNPRADRPMSRAAKARALVADGQAATLAEARAQLADMGE